MNKTFTTDEHGYYGEFGGAFIPEMLRQNIESLKSVYYKIIESTEFNKEYNRLLKDYAGRPSPLFLANRLSSRYGAKIYLKREDLNHTGSHKINNTIGQILMAKKMNKTRIIAENGSRSAWGRNCNSMCTHGYGVCCLYGRNRYGEAGTKCKTYGNAWSNCNPGKVR